MVGAAAGNEGRVVNRGEGGGGWRGGQAESRGVVRGEAEIDGK